MKRIQQFLLHFSWNPQRKHRAALKISLTTLAKWMMNETVLLWNKVNNFIDVRSTCECVEYSEYQNSHHFEFSSKCEYMDEFISLNWYRSSHRIADITHESENVKLFPCKYYVSEMRLRWCLLNHDFFLFVQGCFLLHIIHLVLSSKSSHQLICMQIQCARQLSEIWWKFMPANRVSHANDLEWYYTWWMMRTFTYWRVKCNWLEDTNSQRLRISMAITWNGWFVVERHSE